MNVPSNLKYTQDHEWTRLEGEVVTVGITEFAAGQLGDIVYVELPKVGATVKANEAFGVVESTKAVSDLCSPIAGTVVEVNGPLADAPETINQDPYDKGWIVRLKAADPGELDGLMDAEEYQAHAVASAH